jgi:hypothetical protein
MGWNHTKTCRIFLHSLIFSLIFSFYFVERQYVWHNSFSQIKLQTSLPLVCSFFWRFRLSYWKQSLCNVRLVFTWLSLHLPDNENLKRLQFCVESEPESHHLLFKITWKPAKLEVHWPLCTERMASWLILPDKQWLGKSEHLADLAQWDRPSAMFLDLI